MTEYLVAAVRSNDDVSQGKLTDVFHVYSDKDYISASQKAQLLDDVSDSLQCFYGYSIIDLTRVEQKKGLTQHECRRIAELRLAQQLLFPYEFEKN